MLFSELYSVYYNTVAGILKCAVAGDLTEQKIKNIVAENAFGESVLTIPAAFRNGRWQLIKRDMSTTVKSSPAMPLSYIEKRWLKAISLDPRIGLFDMDFSGLDGVVPLFTPESVCIYDKYNDGDDYSDMGYITRFKTVVRAIKERQPLKIELENRHGRRVQMNVIPEYLEYSEKDDKFRLITSGCKYGKTINLGRLTGCKPYFGERLNRFVRYEENMAEVSFDLFDGRNTLERAMLHFAHFEKSVEQTNTDKFKVTVKYNTDDETELLIRILSFGPFIKVTKPESFVELIKKRLIEQKRCGLN